MLVSEVMTPDVECVAATMAARDARDLMRRKGIHHLVVTRDDANVLGVVSAHDLDHRAAGPARHLRTVADVMSRHVVTIDEQKTLGRASYVMRGHSIGCLIVLRRGRVVGIVTAADLLGLVGRGAERRPRADTRTAIHHRVGHGHRSRNDGVW